MVVWRTSGIVMLAFYLLVTSIVSCWLLFRVLVWKPSYEYLRPLCSVVFAISVWSVDLCESRAQLAVDVRCDVHSLSLDGRQAGRKHAGGQSFSHLILRAVVIEGFRNVYAACSSIGPLSED